MFKFAIFVDKLEYRYMTPLKSLKVLLSEVQLADVTQEKLMRLMAEQEGELEQIAIFTLAIQSSLEETTPALSYCSIGNGWYASIIQSVAFSNGRPLVDGLERISDGFWHLAVNGFKPTAYGHWLVASDAAINTATSDATLTLSQFTQGLGIPMIEGGVIISSGVDSEPFVSSSIVGVRKGSECKRPLVAGQKVFMFGDYTLPEFYSKEAGVLARSFNFKSQSGSISKRLFAKQVDFALGDLFKADLIEDIEPLTTLGLLRSAAVMVKRSKVGVSLNLSKVLVGASGFSSSEILVSETLNRLMAVCPAGKETIFEVVLEKWDIPYACIGEIIPEEVVSVKGVNGESLIVSIDLGKEFAHKYVYPENTTLPTFVKHDIVDDLDDIEIQQAIELTLSSSSFAPKLWFKEQFDSSLQGGPNLSNPSDAGINILRSLKKNIAVAQVLNPQLSQLDQERALVINFAEATRKVICSGAVPLQATLTPAVFGRNTHHVNTVARLNQLFQTMASKWGVEASSQNSFVKEREDDQNEIFPSIAVLGLVDGPAPLARTFMEKGDMIYLLGDPAVSLSGSELAKSLGLEQNREIPFFDINQEFRLQKAIHKLYQLGILSSAHSVGRGGIFTSLIECGHANGLGFDITTDSEISTPTIPLGFSLFKAMAKSPVPDATSRIRSGLYGATNFTSFLRQTLSIFNDKK